jgi:hypothetical protein
MAQALTRQELGLIFAEGLFTDQEIRDCLARILAQDFPCRCDKKLECQHLAS